MGIWENHGGDEGCHQTWLAGKIIEQMEVLIGKSTITGGFSTTGISHGIIQGYIQWTPTHILYVCICFFTLKTYLYNILMISNGYFLEYHKDIIWNIAGISKCNLEIMYIHLHYTTISSNYERDKLIWILIISIYVYILVCWFQHISTCSPQYEPISAIRGPWKAI